MKFDFSGYATKNNLKCSDGRVIKKDAFKHQNGTKVPLVWQHLKDKPENILGHAVLENREDGVYAYCAFNDTPSGKNAKALVQHGDVESLSIHANKLKQIVSDVIHGMIREVSLVVSGANPGARIDNICIVHSDGSEEYDDSEAIICNDVPIDNTEIEHDYTNGDDHMNYEEVLKSLNDEQKKAVQSLFGKALEHKDDANDSDEKTDDGVVEKENGDIQHANQTVGDIFNTLTDVQKKVVYAMIGQAIEDVKEDDMKQSATNNDGGDDMKSNVFDGQEQTKDKKLELSHSDMTEIITNAQKIGSMKEAVLTHAGTYGIDNIDYLFPDAKLIRNRPDFVKRDTEWVRGVLAGTHKSPFSRIKSVAADITADEARAKGYVTAALKTDEVFELLKRVTTPTTIYKKQKLDRDDVIDITDLDVVAWLKMEMRMMLDEEIARAILVGDGRAAGHADKITETNIRPIYKDVDMYNHKITVANDATTQEVIEAIIRNRKEYKGSGNPTFYCTSDILTDMLLLKDTTGRFIYETMEALAARLRVVKIVEVPVMSDVEREDGDDTHDLLGIIVNLRDYTVGADKGGKVSMFDDFDIDYNQHKYLIEGRMCGALTMPKSAMTVEKTQAAG